LINPPGYDVIEQIGEGRGRFSEVWKARNRATGDLRAIKAASDPRYVSMLRTEGMLQTRLRHDNIVEVIDVVEADQLYVIMELMEEDLGQLLDRARLKEAMERRITEQICHGMKYAHDERILHLDLKPPNILLKGRGAKLVAKVTDFGFGRAAFNIARSAVDDSQYSDHAGRAVPSGYLGGDKNEQEFVMGTVTYMERDLLTGRKKKPDKKSDVVSLGWIIDDMNRNVRGN